MWVFWLINFAPVHLASYLLIATPSHSCMPYTRRTGGDMFLRKRLDTASFKECKDLILKNIKFTDRVLGTGAYGSVEEVEYQEVLYAGKKLHDVLVETGNQGVTQTIKKYEQECQLLSRLHHPNITQFIGLGFLKKNQTPLLVMEKLMTSLDDLLESTPDLSLTIKHSILEDIVCGLVYLHNREPPVIHRDLTAKNVLLTSSLSAKIADVGNSRIINLTPGQMSQTLSKLPGTLVYMPPEALDDTLKYGPSLDVFSFGHLALYTLTQVFPGDLLSSTFYSPYDKRIVGRSEVERREKFIDILKMDIGKTYPALVQLVISCLADNPDLRPLANQLLKDLRGFRVEVEGVYKGSISRLDVDRVFMAMDIRMKDQELKELEEKCHSLEETLQEVNDDDLLAEIKTQQEEIDQLSRDAALKDDLIRQAQQSLQDLTISHQRMEAQIAEECDSKDVEISNLKGNTTKGKVHLTSGWEIEASEIQLLSKISSHHYGEIWKGSWNELSLVSVKFVNPDVKSTQNEIPLLKKLHHPNVIQLFGVCTMNKPILIITELTKCNLLFYLQKDGKSLDMKEIVNLCAQIATGMSYLELKNCVHNNIHAANISLTANMVCKINNFRIAQVIERGQTSQRQQGIEVPVKWTAPESLFYRQVSVKSDVWSFGILTYEIFTCGKIPYKGMKNQEVTEKIQQGYRMLCPTDCPKHFYDRIMFRCWTSEPDQRPTFETLQWQLENFRDNEQHYYTAPTLVN